MRTTIITPTTGADTLRQAIESVTGARHLVVIDGPQFEAKARAILDACDFTGDVITLPENTGGNGYLCHRVYASVPMLVNTEFVAHLDEDNWHSPDFVPVMEAFMDAHAKPVSTCRRILHQPDGTLIGPDDKEAIGVNGLSYRLYDTNCFMYRQSFACMMAPYWYGTWGRDRVVTDFLIDGGHVAHIRRHLTHYRVPERLTGMFT